MGALKLDDLTLAAETSRKKPAYKLRSASGLKLVSKDPMFPISGVNAYEYAINDPINLVDPSGLATGQVGVTVTVTFSGVSVNIGAGVAVDTHGNIAGYYNGGIGAGVGSSVSGGVSFNGSNANTVNDLSGAFITGSASAGEGVNLGVDQFYGYSPTGQPINGGGVTIGIGEGASSSVTYGPTHIGPSLFPPGVGSGTGTKAWCP